MAGKRVLVVEDGPTITHGGMAYGAGYVAASQAGVGEIIDPRLSAVGDIAEVFRRYPHIGKVLPAMGYSAKELGELQATINALECRCRDRRHAERSGAPHAARQAGRPRALRVRRGG